MRLLGLLLLPAGFDEFLRAWCVSMAAQERMIWLKLPSVERTGPGCAADPRSVCLCSIINKLQVSSIISERGKNTARLFQRKHLLTYYCTVSVIGCVIIAMVTASGWCVSSSWVWAEAPAGGCNICSALEALQMNNYCSSGTALSSNALYRAAVFFKYLCVSLWARINAGNRKLLMHHDIEHY